MMLDTTVSFPGIGDEDTAVAVAGLEVGTQGEVSVQGRLGFRASLQVSQRRRSKAQMMTCVWMFKQLLLNRLERLLVFTLSEVGKVKYRVKDVQLRVRRAEFKGLEDGTFPLLIIPCCLLYTSDAAAE